MKGLRKKIMNSPKVLFRPPQSRASSSQKLPTSSRSMDGDSASISTTFNMKLELVELREKLRQLQEAAGDDPMELIDLLNERESELAFMVTKIADLENTRKELADANSGLESEKAQAEKALEKTYADSDNRAEQHKLETDQLIKKLTEESKNYVENIIGEYEKKLESLSNEHKKHVTKAKIEIEQLSSEQKTTSRHLEIRDKEVSTLSLRCAKGLADLGNFISEKDEVVKELNVVQSLLAEATDDIVTLKKGRDSIQAQANNLNAEKSKLETAREALALKLNNVESELVLAKELVEEKIVEVRCKDDAIKNQDKVLLSIKNKYRKEETSLKLVVEDREIKIKSLESNIDDLKNNLTLIKSRKIDEVMELKKINSKLAVDNTTLHERTRKITSDLRSANEKNASQRNDNEALMISNKAKEISLQRKINELEKSLDGSRDEERSLFGRLTTAENEMKKENHQNEMKSLEKDRVILDKEHEIEALGTKIESLSLENILVKKDNEYINATNNRLKISMEKKDTERSKLIKVHEDQIAEKENKLSFLRSELEELGNGLCNIEEENQQMKNNLHLQIEENNKYIVSLQNSNENHKTKAHALEAHLKTSQNDLEQTLTSLSNLEVQLQEKTTNNEKNCGLIAQLKTDVEAKNSTIFVMSDNLKKCNLQLQKFKNRATHLEQSVDSLEKQMEQKNKDIGNFKSEVCKLESGLSEGDKKIQALYQECKQLQDNLQEEILVNSQKFKKILREQTLTAQVASEKSDALSNANRTIDNCTEKIEELKNEVCTYKNSLKTMKDNIRVASIEHDRMVEAFSEGERNLREDVRDILQKNQVTVEKLENELSSTYELLDCEKKQNSNLEDTNIKQNNLVHSLQTEIRELRLVTEKLNNLENKVSALHFENSNLKEKNNLISRKNRIEIDKLEQERACQELKHAALEKNFHDIDTKLDERTNLLSEINDKYKELQIEYEENQTILNELQLQRVEYKQKYEASECDKKKLYEEVRDNAQLINTEKDLVHELHDEVSELRSQLSVMRAEGKNFVSIGKENRELKDKINRQNAYMKRKLAQGRVLKDRGVTLNNRQPTYVVPHDGVDKFSNVTRRSNSSSGTIENDENL